MFLKLSEERHNKQVIKDQNRMIIEAAEEIVEIDDEDNTDGDVLSMEDLDEMMKDDTDVVTDEELEHLETLVGEVADKSDKDVSKMTKEELEKYVDGVEVPTVDELNT